jgi:hypothetical protein
MTWPTMVPVTVFGFRSKVFRTGTKEALLTVG